MEEYAKKDSPPTFLLKTYMMVDDPTTDGLISWNVEGTGFIVWRPAEFARELLPTVFRHGNFASFVRQLNTYEFHKVSADRWEFSNGLFRRGAMDQLHEICRKRRAPNQRQFEKASGFQNLPSASTQYAILHEENERLQRDKDVLSSEVSIVKKKFDKLLDLASDHDQSSNREKRGPKLFGVRLGVRK